MGGESGMEPGVISHGRPGSLEALFERLGADADVAPAYEQLRLRLVTFFRLKFPVDAEALADEAIDRLARRLTDGTEVANLAAYALGIARLLVLEAGTRRRREYQAALDAQLDEQTLCAGYNPLEQGASPDQALPALRACLDALGAQSARLILEYYGADGGAARIERRQRLADRLGMTVNALRNRALRARVALEKCLLARLPADYVNGGSDIPSKTDT